MGLTTKLWTICFYSASKFTAISVSDRSDWNSFTFDWKFKKVKEPLCLRVCLPSKAPAQDKLSSLISGFVNGDNNELSLIEQPVRSDVTSSISSLMAHFDKQLDNQSFLIRYVNEYYEEHIWTGSNGWTFCQMSLLFCVITNLMQKTPLYIYFFCKKVENLSCSHTFSIV